MEQKLKGIILDSSAVLAIINEERGYDSIIDLLENSIMSSVNYAETLGILTTRFNIPKKDAIYICKKIITHIYHYDEEQALLTSDLENTNHKDKLNLSLADKACISLGIALKLPIYTADRTWSKIKQNGLIICQIRD